MFGVLEKAIIACVSASRCCVSALSLLMSSLRTVIVKNADAVWLTTADMKLKDTACLNLVGMCEDM